MSAWHQRFRPLAVLLAAGVLPVFAALPALDPQLAALRAQAQRATSAPQRLETLWRLSDGLCARGLLIEAERTLQQAAPLARNDSDRGQTAVRLAAVLTAEGRVDEATNQLAFAKSVSAKLPAPDLLRLKDTEANLAVRNGDLTLAEQSFEAEAAQAHEMGFASAEARARINAMRARMDRKDLAGLEERVQRLYELTQALPASEESAVLELSVGGLFTRSVREFKSAPEIRARAYYAITQARARATTVATRAYASGLLARLYEDEGRTQDALLLTTEAIFLAQSADAQDQLFRWEWQAGRLERKLGEGSASTQSLDQALFTVSPIRDDVLKSSRRAFSETIEPLYLDYADVHLREAAARPDGSPEQQKMLRNVRDELESLKQAEVQDYFESSCATADATKANAAFNVPGAAVIYPILLSDRLEVLIETHGTLRQFAVPISKAKVTAAVRQLRLALERATTGEQYLKPAQTLYDWVLRGADPWLQSQKVDTLVFVPSGPLRTIPLAVLHDRQRFTIERYSVATTPAITLIPTLTQPGKKRVLVAGLTESVQGFAPLPSVDREIHTIEGIFPTEALENKTFQLTTIRTDLSQSNYTIAHLATHGEFSADHRQSFVLTYDSRLTMDGLQTALGLRAESLDLLVLSACSTAAGDDRAALGLAGVAVQSGAKSALASLWSISDAATAALMDSFYQSRKAGSGTKAQNLRTAQLALLHSANFQHPSYWAPYLLIGNWL